jgi:hypothetical protein
VLTSVDSNVFAVRSPDASFNAIVFAVAVVTAVVALLATLPAV